MSLTVPSPTPTLSGEEAAGGAGNKSALCADTSSLTLLSSPPPPLLHLQRTETRSQRGPVGTSAGGGNQSSTQAAGPACRCETPPSLSAPRTERRLQHHGQRLGPLQSRRETTAGRSSTASSKGQNTRASPLWSVKRRNTTSGGETKDCLLEVSNLLCWGVNNNHLQVFSHFNTQLFTNFTLKIIF